MIKLPLRMSALALFIISMSGCLAIPPVSGSGQDGLLPSSLSTKAGIVVSAMGPSNTNNSIQQPNWFLANFLPSLAATLVGIIVGLPVALWINSKAGQAASVERRREERKLLLAGLKLLLTAMKHNRERLLIHMQNLEKGMALFDLDLDTVAWDAVRDQIFPALNNPAIHGKTALHFVRLAKIVKLSDSYLDMIAGIASAIGGVDNTKNLLRTHLVQSAGALFNEAGEIGRNIEEIIKDLEELRPE